MGAPLIGVAPIFAVCFWGFDMGKRLVRSALRVPEGTDLTFLQVGIAGSLSAVPATVSYTECHGHARSAAHVTRVLAIVRALFSLQDGY